MSNPVHSTAVREPVPYKELDYFEEGDSGFAGRNRDVDELIARIRVSRCVVLYGRSGLGKTSLLKAGVFPLLRLENYRPLYIRTLDSPMNDLSRVLRDALQVVACGSFDESSDAEALLKALAQTQRSIPVLVFDQFEEFFTRFARRKMPAAERYRQRTKFINAICRLVVNTSPDIRIVFSLREDYLHTLDAFQRKVPELFQKAYRLLPLTAPGARDAIVAPLIAAKTPFDERFVTDLLNHLAEFDFESAHLQIACSETYRAAIRDRDVHGNPIDDFSIGEKNLDSILDVSTGSLAGLFKAYLQGGLNNLPVSAHLLARQLLDTLFSAKGTKYALSLSYLCELGFADRDETVAVLNTLSEQKILRKYAIDDSIWFELRHECLVEPIEEWLNEHEGFAKYRLVREIIAANVKGGRFRTQFQLLLSEEQFLNVSEHKERFRLRGDEYELVFLSAVRHSSSDLCFWAEKVGWEKSKHFILAAMADSSEAMRRGGAFAAGMTPDPFESAFKPAVSIARDSRVNSTTRAAAVRAMVRHGSDRDMLALREFLRPFGIQLVDREILAELHGLGRTALLSYASRCLARHLWKKRQLDAATAVIRDCRNAGMTAGLISSAVWAVIPGLFFLLFLAGLMLLDLRATATTIGTFLSLVAICALVVGAVGGAVVGSSFGIVATVNSEVDCSLAIRRSKLVAIYFGVLTILPFLYETGWRDFLWDFWLEQGTLGRPEEALYSEQGIHTNILLSVVIVLFQICIFAFGGWAFRRLLGFVVYLARSAIGAATWTRHVSIILVGFFAFAPFALFLILLSHPRFDGYYREILYSDIAVFVFLGGFLAFAHASCVAVAAAISSESGHKRPVRIARPLIPRITISSVAFVSPVLILYFFGADGFPLPFSWLPKPQIIEEQLVGKISFSVAPDNSSVAIVSPQHPLLDLSVLKSDATPSKIDVYLAGRAIWRNWDGEVTPSIFLPYGAAKLSFQASSPSEIDDYEYTLRPIPIAAHPVNVGSSEWTLSIVDAQLGQSLLGGSYFGELPCVVSSEGKRNCVKVVVLAVSEQGMDPLYEAARPVYVHGRFLHAKERVPFHAVGRSGLPTYTDASSTVEELERFALRRTGVSTDTCAPSFVEELERLIGSDETFRQYYGSGYSKMRDGEEIRVRFTNDRSIQFPIRCDARNNAKPTAKILVAVCIEPATGIYSRLLERIERDQPVAPRATAQIAEFMADLGRNDEAINIATSSKEAEILANIGRKMYKNWEWKDAARALSALGPKAVDFGLTSLKVDAIQRVESALSKKPIDGQP